MARIDKYEPKGGGTRGELAAALTGQSAPRAVGADVNGRIVPGAGNTGIIGVLVLPKDKPARAAVDVMTDGELVEFAGVAGTAYTANTTTGVISSAAASATQIPIGYTLEATRLVVRVAR